MNIFTTGENMGLAKWIIVLFGVARKDKCNLFVTIHFLRLKFLRIALSHLPLETVH